MLRRKKNVRSLQMFRNITYMLSGLVLTTLLGGCQPDALQEVEPTIIEQTEAPSTDTQPSIAEEQTDEKPTFIAHYLPQPPVSFATYKQPETPKKGIYVTANTAGIDDYFNPVIDLINKTEINAIVTDVKTDDGRITFKGIPAADDDGISVNFIPDIRAVLDKMEENDIFPIARIVCFKDNAAFEKHPDLYIKNQDGSIWRDSKKPAFAWMNPYNKDSWDYILNIAIAAAELGFKEIQFDYVRFDTSPRIKDADFGDTQGKTKIEIISEFVQYATDTLKPYGVMVSADVYGTIINSRVDAEIVGQDYVELAKILDYICPMVYPSHYAAGSMGLDYPDIEPYETIFRSMELSNEKLASIPEGEHRAIVRPWLQDFTASWIKPHLKYGGAEREQQILGAKDANIEEWLLWDPVVSYDESGLAPQ